MCVSVCLLHVCLSDYANATLLICVCVCVCVCVGVCVCVCVCKRERERANTALSGSSRKHSSSPELDSTIDAAIPAPWKHTQTRTDTHRHTQPSLRCLEPRTLV